MTAVYEEIIDFIAAGTTPTSIAAFEPSQAAKDYVFDLIRRQKTTGISESEKDELDHFLHLEHIMRMAKARAREHLGEK